MDSAYSSADRRLGRMDFTFEVVRTDKASGTVCFTVVPDERRYETIEREGEKFYLDKFLRVLISDEDMKDHIVNQMPGLPFYQLEPSIKSTPAYADKRRPAIASELRTGQFIPPEEKAVPHKRLEDNPTSRDIAFLSIDICGSSSLRSADPSAFDCAYKIMLHELGTLVGQFNGSILKLTGDGFIAVIDHPSFTRQCDNAVDLGLSFLVMLRDSVNPALKEVGINPLKIRVGADYGAAIIQQLEIPPTGFSQLDIASDALNRAVKIEQSCEENEFRIGRALYELVHVQWLQRAKNVEFDGANVGIPDYEVYRIT